MRTAIVHYWLLNMRGGEKVLEALCRLLPDADVFTLFYDPEKVSPFLRSRVVKTSFLNPLRRYYRSSLPLMPIALEHLDLRGYDLVISSESGPAKGVITASDTRHICYCHSPMRYLWDLYPDYLHQWTRRRWKRWFMALACHRLRQWDFSTAARVDDFVANSRNVQRRIWKTYRRESQVIYPPVAAGTFYWRPAESYYLIVAGLVAYKRIDDAVRCFSQSGRKLKIAGDGPEYRALRKLAKPNIEFCGTVSDGDLRELYAKCRALIMPGEEDFGLAPVEAMASGKAVIALGRGGVLESVPGKAPRAGFFYGTPGNAALERAVLEFEACEGDVSPLRLQAVAARFTESRFASEMAELIAGEAPKSREEPPRSRTANGAGSSPRQ
jgi:glycosyltransferase involved in cell wall biosynthesis